MEPKGSRVKRLLCKPFPLLPRSVSALLGKHIPDSHRKQGKRTLSAHPVRPSRQDHYPSLSERCKCRATLLSLGLSVPTLLRMAQSRALL